MGLTGSGRYSGPEGALGPLGGVGVLGVIRGHPVGPQRVEGCQSVLGACKECRYSGARRGIDGIRGNLGTPGDERCGPLGESGV